MPPFLYRKLLAEPIKPGYTIDHVSQGRAQLFMEIELAKPLVARIFGKNMWQDVRNANIKTECSTNGLSLIHI